MKKERTRVLLVENDEVDRMAFERVIDKQKMDYELTMAISVSEAKDILEKNEFDIIVSDYKLGDGTAFDVIELQDKVPIIITTGSGSEDTAVRAIKSGVYEYLVKDVEGKYLKRIPDVIRTVLEKHILVHEKRLAEEALKDSEEKFRTLTESNNDVLYKVNSEGIMDYVSPQVEIYGIDPEEVITKGLEEYIHPDDKDLVMADFLRTITTGEEFPTVFRIMNESGEIFWLEDKGKVLKDEYGNISGINGVLRDVTLRKNMEEALLDSEEKFRTISASAQDAIIMIDNYSRVTFWNEAAEKIFGYSDDELYGNEIHKFIVPSEYTEAVAEGFKKFRTTGQGGAVGKTMILKGKRKDGTIFPVELSMSSVKLRGEWCAVGILRDITAREEAHKRLLEMNEELVHADQLKDNFLSITSHELRNPLAGIIGVLELLQENLYRDQDELMEFIKTMHVTSKEMLATLNDLLDLQKMEAGKIELNYEEFDVTEIFEELDMLYGRELKENGIELILKTPPAQEGKIDSDRHRLKEVLTNLVTNALKFTESGSITLSARKKDDQMVFEVIDTGIGIKKEDISELFVPFSQLHRKTKKEIKGTGLGLAICKSIVKTLGGRIWIESEGVGKGTKVSFTIPQNKGKEPT